MKNVSVAGALLIVVLAVFAIGLSFYGLYLAFSASIILGILALIVEPSPLVIGIAMFVWDKNIPEAIMTWFNS